MSVRRPLLLPLVPLYATALRWKNRGFDTGRSPARCLNAPVLSVGSISAGGAGKTPFLIALAGLLRDLGYAPDVLSRGYGRSSRGALRVDPGGSARLFGDEPLLLAQTLGCPVFVGEERYEAGRLAEQSGVDSRREIHLLDDGFGHRRLARTIDIALVTAEDLADTLLPAGNLREPVAALQRADILVVRAGESPAVLPLLQRFLPSPRRVWTIERHMTLPSSMPGRPFVFSGIARPADFEAMLLSRGVRAAGMHRFADHHRYTEREMEALARKARKAGADGFLTTRKDAVKLDDPMRRILKACGSLAVADAVVHLQSRGRCADDLRDLLQSGGRFGKPRAASSAPAR